MIQRIFYTFVFLWLLPFLGVSQVSDIPRLDKFLRNPQKLNDQMNLDLISYKGFRLSSDDKDDIRNLLIRLNYELTELVEFDNSTQIVFTEGSLIQLYEKNSSKENDKISFEELKTIFRIFNTEFRIVRDGDYIVFDKAIQQTPDQIKFIFSIEKNKSNENFNLHPIIVLLTKVNGDWRIEVNRIGITLRKKNFDELLSKIIIEDVVLNPSNIEFKISRLSRKILNSNFYRKPPLMNYDTLVKQVGSSLAVLYRLSVDPQLVNNFNSSQTIFTLTKVDEGGTYLLSDKREKYPNYSFNIDGKKDIDLYDGNIKVPFSVNPNRVLKGTVNLADRNSTASITIKDQDETVSKKIVNVSDTFSLRYPIHLNPQDLSLDVQINQQEIIAPVVGSQDSKTALALTNMFTSAINQGYSYRFGLVAENYVSRKAVVQVGLSYIYKNFTKRPQFFANISDFILANPTQHQVGLSLGVKHSLINDKINLIGGAYFNYAFIHDRNQVVLSNASVSLTENQNISYLSDFEIGYRISLTYDLWKKWGVSVTYSRPINNLLEEPNLFIDDVIRPHQVGGGIFYYLTK